MEAQMGAPAFWDNPERAQKHIAKLNGLKRAIGGLLEFNQRLADAGVMVELVGAAAGTAQERYGRELDQTVAVLVGELDRIELQSFLSGQFDRNNAILSI
ncbi:MAG: PCRF domain-containing protein, partial [Opitutaceae bacterium]